MSFHSGTVAQPWGYYEMQWEEGSCTSSLKAEFGFTEPPGLLQVSVPITKPLHIFSVSGNSSLVCWSAAPSENNASVVADVWAINPQGNDILVVQKLQVLGSNFGNLPVYQNFKTGVRANALMVQFYVDMQGAQTFNWGLCFSHKSRSLLQKLRFGNQKPA